MYPQRWIAPAVLILIWGVWGLMDLANLPTGGFDWGDSVILSVEPGGPAEKAGLREGDRILTMGGIPTDDLETLRRQPRTEIGDTRVLVVERTNEATGVTTTENIEITYSRLPGSERTLNVVAGVIGIVFLLSGMIVFVRAPTTPSLLFAIVGFGFATMLLPNPYIGSYGLRILTMNLFFVVFLTGFASLLHLLLVFPRRKKVMEIEIAGKLIYVPVVAFTLLGIVNFTVGLPPYIPTTFILGLIFVGYLALSLIALIHSFVTTPPQERAERGLNFMLAGVVVGVLPLTCMMVAGMFVRTDLIPGTDYLFLTLALIPVSFALALLKGTGASLQPT